MRRIELSTEQLSDTIMRLIGEIEPVGDTNIDTIRLMNMHRLQELIESLIFEVNYVCAYSDNKEFSMKTIGEDAVAWLRKERDFLNRVV
jgi:hypothetical protein